MYFHKLETKNPFVVCFPQKLASLAMLLRNPFCSGSFTLAVVINVTRKWEQASDFIQVWFLL